MVEKCTYTLSGYISPCYRRYDVEEMEFSLVTSPHSQLRQWSTKSSKDAMLAGRTFFNLPSFSNTKFWYLNNFLTKSNYVMACILHITIEILSSHFFVYQNVIYCKQKHVEVADLPRHVFLGMHLTLFGPLCRVTLSLPVSYQPKWLVMSFFMSSCTWLECNCHGSVHAFQTAWMLGFRTFYIKILKNVFIKCIFIFIEIYVFSECHSMNVCWLIAVDKL